MNWFKRKNYRIVVSIIFSLAFMFSICGCGSNENGDSVSDTLNSSVSQNQSSFSSDTLNDDKNYDVKAVVYNGFDKFSSDIPCELDDTVFQLGAAKNEAESVHISFTAKKDVSNVKLIVEGDLNGVEIDIFTENYVPCGDTMYPDPLVPFDGEEFVLLSGNNITFFVDIKVLPKAVTGKRTLKFCLKSNDEAVSNSVAIDLTVWNFEFSNTPASLSAVGLNREYLETHTGDYSEETYIQYYELLLDHGLSPYDLPYDILDNRADKYMSDPRVTSFRVPCSHDVQEQRIIDYYTKIKSNPEWLKKAYFYPIDEPTTVEKLRSLQTRCEYLKLLCPEIKIICPYYTNIDVTSDYDQTQFLLDTVDVPCPKPCMWDDKTVYSDAQLEKFPSFKSRMDDHLARGRELWWYVCNTPGKPYLNLFVDENGLDHRVLFWQQYRYGVEGFLYWCTNYWLKTNDPWTDVDTKTLKYPVYGEGLLLYPGDKVGINGPVASLRLKAVRDGIEDYKLLLLAEETLGKNYILNKVISVSPDVANVSVNNVSFSEIRNIIGNDIENALNQ